VAANGAGDGRRPGFSWPVRVYYEDTDAGGVVYYASYLRFMERARTEWLRQLGFEQDVLRDQHRIVFAVAALQIDFLRPARFNDLLTVDVTILRCRRASLKLAHNVTRRNAELVCRGAVRIACVDVEDMKPRPMPATILSEILRDH